MFIRGMMGLGDNIYARAFIRQYPGAYLETPWPQLYSDIDVKCVRPTTQLRTQSKNAMPIYKDQTDCLRSKHYKPGEHLHYWSLRGLIGWFARQGFGCVEINEKESELGREGITSFAFRRYD